jgi:hypothetical protein
MVMVPGRGGWNHGPGLLYWDNASDSSLSARLIPHPSDRNP